MGLTIDDFNFEVRMRSREDKTQSIPITIDKRPPDPRLMFRPEFIKALEKILDDFK